MCNCTSLYYLPLFARSGILSGILLHEAIISTTSPANSHADTVLANDQHVLHYTVPDRNNHSYNLRNRRHELNETVGILLKDSYLEVLTCLMCGCILSAVDIKVTVVVVVAVAAAGAC